LSNDHKTDPPRKIRPVLRPTGFRSGNEEGMWSPALKSTESAEMKALVVERDHLREQLTHVKDLSSRLIDRVDEQTKRIEELEADLHAKEALIRDYEAEAAELIAHASNREDHVNALKTELQELASANDEITTQVAKRAERIAQLESFLKMIAEADGEK
jgi:phage shock protein A